MMKKLKIVRVITASYVVPWHLENTLKRLPNDFEVCVIGDGVSFYKDVYPNVKWVDIEINRKINLISDVIALFKLCRFFILYKPDIVHSIMHKTALLAAIAGFVCRVPVRVNTFTGQYWATKTGLARAVYYASDWLTNLLDTYCLTDSPSQSQYLCDHKISKYGRPLPVLVKGSLSGVDIDRFNLHKLTDEALNLSKELGLTEEHFVFLFLARKTRDKGAIDILHAFNQVCIAHPEARLLFVGPDESNGEIERLMKENIELFTNVISISRSVENRELYIAISNVLCLPSYKEGFGSIVIDAAALGVPTIGSNISGFVDSIDNGKTGVLFPMGDVNALTEVMLNFIEMPEKFSRMGLAAKRRVEEFFSADIMYEALRDCYIKLAGSAETRGK